MFLWTCGTRSIAPKAGSSVQVFFCISYYSIRNLAVNVWWSGNQKAFEEGKKVEDLSYAAIKKVDMPESSLDHTQEEKEELVKKEPESDTAIKKADMLKSRSNHKQEQKEPEEEEELDDEDLDELLAEYVKDEL